MYLFDSDTNLLEEFYIKKFNTLSPNGYNLTTGGKNCRVSEETRLKMSNALKNRAGHKHNKETIMKISFSLRGKLNPNYGKQMSLEQRTKISKRMKEIYSNKTELTEPQLTGLDIGRNKIKRKVGKYDVKCNLIETYNSISEAGRLNNIDHSAISKVCRCLPKQKTAAGFIWKYIE